MSLSEEDEPGQTQVKHRLKITTKTSTDRRNSNDKEIKEEIESDLEASVKIKSPKKLRKEFKVVEPSKIERYSFTELLEYTKELSFTFKKRDKKVKKLREKVKFLKSVISKLRDKNKETDRVDALDIYMDVGDIKGVDTPPQSCEETMQSESNYEINNSTEDDEIDRSTVPEYLKIAIVNIIHVEGRIGESVWSNFQVFFRNTIQNHTKKYWFDMPYFDFCGLKSGIRCISCGNDSSLDFLKKFVYDFNDSNHDNCFLSVLPRDNIPKWFKFLLSIKVYSEDEFRKFTKQSLVWTNYRFDSVEWLMHPLTATASQGHCKINIIVSMRENKS